MTSFGAMLGFGRLALGIAVLFLCLIWARHKEYRHIWVALLVGSIQGTLDMILMVILWYQPYDILVHLFDIFIYSTWLLLFRIEKMDVNGLLLYLMLTTLMGAFLEHLAIDLARLEPTRILLIDFLWISGFDRFGIALLLWYYAFYPIGWNAYLSLIYFGAMSAIGIGLYLLIYDRELIRKLFRNELWNDQLHNEINLATL